jgi:hypothetical protein
VAASTRLFVIPNGALIPARGHYLAVNSLGFSLSNYPAAAPGSGVGFGDNTYATDIGDSEGIALFNTANTASYSTTTRLDAVGIAAPPPKPAGPGAAGRSAPQVSDPLFAEGTPIPSVVTIANEHSWVRRLETGRPLDTNNNATDFVLVSTFPGQFEGFLPAVLGAPGPESSQSPVQRNNLIKASFVDGGCHETSDPALACARTRYVSDTGTNRTFGTMRIRRRWTNATELFVSRLRFRVVDVTTDGSPAVCAACAQADLRALSSADETGLLLSGGGTADTFGLTLEEPPAQPEGGGLNSTLAAGVVTLDAPLGPGESVNLNFLLGVERQGVFRFYVNVEILSGPPPVVELGTRPSKVRGRHRLGRRKN